MNDPSAERPSSTLGDLRPSSEAEAADFVEASRTAEQKESESGIEARLDSPHAPRKLPAPHGPGEALGPKPDKDPAAPYPTAFPDDEWDVATSDTGPLPEKWRRHARELAEYLRRRQRDLDEREARLNSDVAKLEHEDRLLRLLWSQRIEEWEEKRLEFARREAELDHRESTLRRREEELENQAAALRTREEVLDQREYQIGLGEFDLAARRREWESRVRAFEEHSRDLEALAVVLVSPEPSAPTISEISPQAASRAADEEKASRETTAAGDFGPEAAQTSSAPEWSTDDDLRHRERSLAEVEAQANHLRHRAEDLLRVLEEDRDKLRQEARDLRNRWATLERQLLADWTARNRVLLEREQALRTAAAKNQAVLEAADSLHRRALEHRAAAEELLVRLSGRASQVVLRKRLSQLRRALKAAYQERADAAENKLAECRRIQQETAALQEAVAKEWQRHDAALTERRQELLEQARELARREEELRLAERDRLLEVRKAETVELRLLTEIHRLRERLRETGDPA
ncbi:MAG: hypothetical protein Kow0040_23610 [Thermogutta sp.]